MSATGPRRKNNRRRAADGSTTLLAYGEPMIWLTGGGLALAILMIVGLVGLVFYQGVFNFWPSPLLEVTLHDGTVHMGEVTRTERYEAPASALDGLPDEVRVEAQREMERTSGWVRRRLLRTGNFELSGEHFDWVSDYRVATESYPSWGIVVERLTWGRFYGDLVSFRIAHPLEEDTVAEARRVASVLEPDDTRRLECLVDGHWIGLDEAAGDARPSVLRETWKKPADAWRGFERHHRGVRARWRRRRKLEKSDSGAISHRAEAARLALRAAEIDAGRAEQRFGPDAPRTLAARERLATERQEQAEVEEWAEREFARVREEINRIDSNNSRFKLILRTSQSQEIPIELAEIVRAYPANQQTTGDRAGVYISRWKEFLTDDPREANMEGGVFPAIFGTVVMTLIMSVAVAPFGVLAALYLREYAKAGPMISAVRIAINNLAGVPSIVFGVFGLGFFCYLVGGQVDSLFFEAKLPSPTFGTGGIMWASLTLALLTLPVVIVATEEALAAVPGSMREGSYACGAGKWQTLRRIVLPRAMPGIMTGMILAMARGAGEVAPLMLVGAVKLAPELPVDGIFPYLHPERSFMHLGFHIFDLGFQSQNSEAAKPMVFTTTLLLIVIVATLNIAAVVIRNRLRRRFHADAF